MDKFHGCGNKRHRGDRRLSSAQLSFLPQGPLLFSSSPPPEEVIAAAKILCVDHFKVQHTVFSGKYVLRSS